VLADEQRVPAAVARVTHYRELLVERANHVGVKRLLVGDENADLHAMILSARAASDADDRGSAPHRRASILPPRRVVAPTKDIRHEPNLAPIRGPNSIDHWQACTKPAGGPGGNYARPRD